MDQDLYRQIKTRILLLMGINLDPYKDEQMRRRLDSWLARSGAPDWDAFFIRIKDNGTDMERFRDYLTINVTEFFRDPERWNYVRQNIIPELLRKSNTDRKPDGTGLKIWSAGCSTGAEAYTLSIILDELNTGK